MTARTLNKGHGRLETRQCWVITDPDCLDQNRQQWANLNAVVKVRLSGRRQPGPRSTLATISAARPAQTLKGA